MIILLFYLLHDVLNSNFRNPWWYRNIVHQLSVEIEPVPVLHSYMYMIPCTCAHSYNHCSDIFLPDIHLSLCVLQASRNFATKAAPPKEKKVEVICFLQFLGFWLFFFTLRIVIWRWVIWKSCKLRTTVKFDTVYYNGLRDELDEKLFLPWSFTLLDFEVNFTLCSLLSYDPKILILLFFSFFFSHK